LGFCYDRAVKRLVFLLLLIGCGPAVSGDGETGQVDGSGGSGDETSSTTSSGTTGNGASGTGLGEGSTTGSSVGGSSSSGGSSSTGEVVVACGCPEDPEAFPYDPYEFCEDLSPMCPPLEFDCGDRNLAESELCLPVLPPLDPEQVAALDCQLASIQAEDTGEVSIRLSWLSGYGRAYRQLLIDSAQLATGFENAYVDIPSPPTATVGGNPAVEAAACAAIEDANERLLCAWEMYRLEAPIVCA
jgi:hypothetical protein